MASATAIKRIFDQVADLEEKLVPKKSLVALFIKQHSDFDRVVEKHCEMFPEDNGTKTFVGLRTRYSIDRGEYEKIYSDALNRLEPSSDDYRCHAAEALESAEARGLGKAECLRLWGRRLLTEVRRSDHQWGIDLAGGLVRELGLARIEVLNHLKAQGVDINDPGFDRIFDVGLTEIARSENFIARRARESAEVQHKRSVETPRLVYATDSIFID